MKLEEIHNVYFLGIGGIGMSALARWFHYKGFLVSGYDKTVTSLTGELEKEGVQIYSEDKIDLIPDQIKEDKEASLIVYTPAIPNDLSLLNYFESNGFKIYKRSQVLGMLTASKFTIAVAGTHGKTTTSSMIAHLLRSVGIECSAFVGGIMSNYNSNLLIGGENEVMVVEADEFDRSFLTLHPDIAIITATDADHLDIYGDRDALRNSFKDFIGNMKANGTLFIEEKAAKDLRFESNQIRSVSYGLRGGEITTKNLHIETGDFYFDFESKDRQIPNLKMNMPGFHNVSNALAALAAVSQLQESNDKIRKGLSTYRGVKRRFEYIIKSDECIFIDDYAHHPEEIKALLGSVQEMYPSREITIVFQPHLFSRTRDFAEGFVESLSMADHVVLLDIYPARELPIPGITSEVIQKKIQAKSVNAYAKEDVLEYFENHRPELVLTVGAGDIDTLVLPIKQKLEE